MWYPFLFSLFVLCRNRSTDSKNTAFSDSKCIDSTVQAPRLIVLNQSNFINLFINLQKFIRSADGFDQAWNHHLEVHSRQQIAPANSFNQPFERRMYFMISTDSVVPHSSVSGCTISIAETVITSAAVGSEDSKPLDVR